VETFVNIEIRERDVGTWADTLNRQGYGIYFAINPLKDSTRSKASKVDVLEARWLWVDCDPSNGLPDIQRDEWRKSKLVELRTGKDDIPPPTLIIDSARGYWAFWELSKREPVDGDGPATARVEAYGRALAKAFGGDHCSDIARVARLPGYVNYKTGARACVVEYHSERVYSLDDFPRPIESIRKGGEHSAEVDSNLTNDETAQARVVEYLKQKAPIAIEGRGGRCTTMLVLQRCQDFGCDFDTSIELMEEHWNDRCSPPWAPDEIAYSLRDLRRNDPIGVLHPQFVVGQAFEGVVFVDPPLSQSSPCDNMRLPANSDQELARHFAGRHAGDLRYVDGWGKWLVWTGAHWRVDDTLHVRDLVSTVSKEAASKVAERAAKTIASAKTVQSVEWLARSDRRLAATVDQWDRDAWLLNTPDGVIDMRNGERREHDPRDHMTKITAVSPEGDCPLFLAFLMRVTAEDAELIAYLQRALGYAITGLTQEHALFFAYGTGANGKSVLLSTIAGILGDYHRTAPMETFVASNGERHPTEIAGLRGARFVTATETEANRHWAEARIKQLTGGDMISARFMRQDFFEFRPTFKLLIAGNHMPSLNGVDESIRRRLHLIPFRVTIPVEERDAELPEKLKVEWPGILRWLIEGALEWQKMGLQPPKAVAEATEAYLSAEDAIGSWLAERCIVDVNEWTSSAALWASWSLWANLAGEPVGTQKSFVRNLMAREFAQMRKNDARGVSGLRLVQEPMPIPAKIAE
jgi:putative DNA primase/helicase